MDLDVDLAIYFKKYQDYCQKIDEVFQKMEKDFPDEVKRGNKCTDCCYALFDLSLIEALYLNEKFNALDDDVKNRILIEADKADRKIHKIKRNLFKEHQQGADEKDILSKASREKARCPLLVDNRCALYDHRPITCRLYGIPMDMGHIAASCSLSGFEQGFSYPTVHMGKVHDTLHAMSEEVAIAINSKYPELRSMLVPVSMCLLTDYSKEYLGVKEKPKSPKNDSPTKEWVLGPNED